MSFSNRVILVVDDDPDICWAKLRSLAEGAQIAAARAGP